MTAVEKVNLETVDPKGRIDVLTYKGAEHLARLAEAKWGVKGIWDAVKPHVHEIVTKNITGMNIPPEAKIILGILQANYVEQQQNQNVEGQQNAR